MANIYDPVGNLRIARVQSELLDPEIAHKHKVEDESAATAMTILQRASLALGARLSGVVRTASVGVAHRTGHTPASA